MCNANNHPPDCTCGFGGTGHLGRRADGFNINLWSDLSIPNSSGFELENGYVINNAKCPVCGDNVYFVKTKNGGRVFFDELGWPWPKHPCTDNLLKGNLINNFGEDLYSVPLVFSQIEQADQLVTLESIIETKMFEFYNVSSSFSPLKKEFIAIKKPVPFEDSYLFSMNFNLRQKAKKLNFVNILEFGEVVIGFCDFLIVPKRLSFYSFDGDIRMSKICAKAGVKFNEVLSFLEMVFDKDFSKQNPNKLFSDPQLIELLKIEFGKN